MPGVTRRHKPLKAQASLDDLTDLVIANPEDGDLLVFESSDQLWHNSKSLTGDYTLAGSLTATTLVTTGDLTVGDDLVVADDAQISGDLSVTGNLTVDGSISFINLSVSNNLTVGNDLTVAGDLTGAGFSFSGSGTIAGSLTVGTTLSVTGAVTLSSTLNVTGATTLSTLSVTSDAFVGGNLSAVGAISAGGAVSGASLNTGGDANVLGELNLGTAVYTDQGITYADDGDAVDIYNGSTLILSLEDVSILEGTGIPSNTTGAQGSLFLRTDGPQAETLYVRGPEGWFPVRDHSEEIDFLLLDYHQRAELTITAELQANSVHTDELVADSILLNGEQMPEVEDIGGPHDWYGTYFSSADGLTITETGNSPVIQQTYFGTGQYIYDILDGATLFGVTVSPHSGTVGRIAQVEVISTSQFNVYVTDAGGGLVDCAHYFTVWTE